MSKDAFLAFFSPTGAARAMLALRKLRYLLRGAFMLTFATLPKKAHIIASRRAQALKVLSFVNFDAASVRKLTTRQHAEAHAFVKKLSQFELIKKKFV